jgi:WD40 repeat protein
VSIFFRALPLPTRRESLSPQPPRITTCGSMDPDPLGHEAATQALPAPLDHLSSVQPDTAVSFAPDEPLGHEDPTQALPTPLDVLPSAHPDATLALTPHDLISSAPSDVALPSAPDTTPAPLHAHNAAAEGTASPFPEPPAAVPPADLPVPTQELGPETLDTDVGDPMAIDNPPPDAPDATDAPVASCPPEATAPPVDLPVPTQDLGPEMLDLGVGDVLPIAIDTPNAPTASPPGNPPQDRPGPPEVGSSNPVEATDVPAASRAPPPPSEDTAHRRAKRPRTVSSSGGHGPKHSQAPGDALSGHVKTEEGTKLEDGWDVRSEGSVHTADFFSDAGALELLAGEELFGDEELAIVARAEAGPDAAPAAPVPPVDLEAVQDDDFCAYTRRAGWPPLWCVAWAPDGMKVYAGAEDGRILVLDGRPTEKYLTELSVLVGHTLAVVSVALPPSGAVLASCSLDCTIRIWNVQRSKVAHRRIPVRPMDFWTVAFHPTGHLLASTASGVLRLYNVASLETRTITCLPSAEPSLGTAVAFSPNGKLVAVGFRNGAVALAPPEVEGVTPTLIRRHAAGVRSVAFARGSDIVLAATDDAVVHVYDVATTALVRSLRGHTASVTGVAVAANGAFAATCGADLRVKIFDTATWRCWRTWGPPYHVEWTASLVDQHFGRRDGERIARWKLFTDRKKIPIDKGPNPVSNADLVAYLRANPTLFPPPKRELHDAAVTGVAFARDGRLCSVSHDGTVVGYAAAPYSLTIDDLRSLDNLLRTLEEKGDLQRRQRQDAKFTEFNAAREEFA